MPDQTNHQTQQNQGQNQGSILSTFFTRTNARPSFKLNTNNLEVKLEVAPSVVNISLSNNIINTIKDILKKGIGINDNYVDDLFNGMKEGMQGDLHCTDGYDSAKDDIMKIVKCINILKVNNNGVAYVDNRDIPAECKISENQYVVEEIKRKLSTFIGGGGDDDEKKKRANNVRKATGVLSRSLIERLVNTIEKICRNITNFNNLPRDKKLRCMAWTSLALASAYTDLLNGNRKVVAYAEAFIGGLRGVAFTRTNDRNLYLPFCPSSSDIVTLVWLAIGFLICAERVQQAGQGGTQ